MCSSGSYVKTLNQDSGSGTGIWVVTIQTGIDINNFMIQRGISWLMTLLWFEIREMFDGLLGSNESAAYHF
jgi:hypothetical protein